MHIMVPMSTQKCTFVPKYIDKYIEYRPLVLTLKVSQPHQSSPRPSGSGLHGNNTARSAMAKELDQVNLLRPGVKVTVGYLWILACCLIWHQNETE